MKTKVSLKYCVNDCGFYILATSVMKELNIFRMAFFYFFLAIMLKQSFSRTFRVQFESGFPSGDLIIYANFPGSKNDLDSLLQLLV